MSVGSRGQGFEPAFFTCTRSDRSAPIFPNWSYPRLMISQNGIDPSERTHNTRSFLFYWLIWRKVRDSNPCAGLRPPNELATRPRHHLSNLPTGRRLVCSTVRTADQLVGSRTYVSSVSCCQIYYTIPKNRGPTSGANFLPRLPLNLAEKKPAKRRRAGLGIKIHSACYPSKRCSIDR